MIIDQIFFIIIVITYRHPFRPIHLVLWSRFKVNLPVCYCSHRSSMYNQTILAEIFATWDKSRGYEKQNSNFQHAIYFFLINIFYTSTLSEKITFIWQSYTGKKKKSR